MLLYCPDPSPRLHYVLDFISDEILMERSVITGDPQTFLHYEGVRINYSHQAFECLNYTIHPHALMKETGIAVQEISMSKWKNLPVFFCTKPGGFDIFAAIFYLLSRYEEYLPHEKDSYGRFSHFSSLAFRENFLDRPLINEWLHAWREELQQLFPEALFRRKKLSLYSYL